MAADVNGSDTLVGRTLLDGILVREKLRATSLGTLYSAEDPNGSEVAVRSYPPPPSIPSRSRFCANGSGVPSRSAIPMSPRCIRSPRLRMA